jgi:hypothetical protein
MKTVMHDGSRILKRKSTRADERAVVGGPIQGNDHRYKSHTQKRRRRPISLAALRVCSVSQTFAQPFDEQRDASCAVNKHGKRTVEIG